MKIKLKGRHFDKSEAELHAVLNTLRENSFQDAFKKWRPKLLFDQTAAPIPEIVDTSDMHFTCDLQYKYMQ
jgi:hypothetical protein